MTILPGISKSVPASHGTNQTSSPKPPGTIKLAFKAFKEVVSASPIHGITYPISQNLQSVLDVLNIFIMGKLIDSVADFLLESTAFDLDTFLASQVFDYFILIVCIAFFTTLFSKVNLHIELVLYDLFYAQFQKKSMTKISTLNLEDIERRRVQNLITRVPSFSFTATWDTYKLVTQMGYNLVLLISSGYIIATQMGWLGIMVLAFVLPEASIRYMYNIRIKKYRDHETERLKYLDYLYQQSMLLPNFSEMRVDNVFNFMTKAYGSSVKKYYKKLNNIRFIRDFWTFLFSWLDGSLVRIVQILLIPVAIARSYTIGTFKYLFDYIDNLYSSSWNVIWNSLMIKTNALYIKDYFDFFEYQGFGDVTSGNETLDPLSVPKIEFVNVDFSYPDSSSAALENISFTIEPGEKIAIIGHDNSGKSTLAKLLCGLYMVGPGDILIDNVSIKNLSRGELKNKIAVVFEDFVKYNFSIRKNITVTQPERDFDKRLYQEALEITGLDEWLDREEIDDSTILGKIFGKGISVSTGHWQRIAISRAVYRDRSVLLLDESLTQIDSFSRRPILEKIIKHRPKQTFIHITQEVANQDLFDTIIEIENGKLKDIRKPKK